MLQWEYAYIYWPQGNEEMSLTYLHPNEPKKTNPGEGKERKF